MARRKTFKAFENMSPQRTKYTGTSAIPNHENEGSENTNQEMAKRGVMESSVQAVFYKPQSPHGTLLLDIAHDNKSGRYGVINGKNCNKRGAPAQEDSGSKSAHPRDPLSQIPQSIMNSEQGKVIEEKSADQNGVKSNPSMPRREIEEFEPPDDAPDKLINRIPFDDDESNIFGPPENGASCGTLEDNDMYLFTGDTPEYMEDFRQVDQSSAEDVNKYFPKVDVDTLSPALSLNIPPFECSNSNNTQRSLKIAESQEEADTCQTQKHRELFRLINRSQPFSHSFGSQIFSSSFPCMTNHRPNTDDYSQFNPRALLEMDSSASLEDSGPPQEYVAPMDCIRIPGRPDPYPSSLGPEGLTYNRGFFDVRTCIDSSVQLTALELQSTHRFLTPEQKKECSERLRRLELVQQILDLDVKEAMQNARQHPGSSAQSSGSSAFVWNPVDQDNDQHPDDASADSDGDEIMEFTGGEEVYYIPKRVAACVFGHRAPEERDSYATSAGDEVEAAEVAESAEDSDVSDHYLDNEEINIDPRLRTDFVGESQPPVTFRPIPPDVLLLSLQPCSPEHCDWCTHEQLFGLPNNIQRKDFGSSTTRICSDCQARRYAIMAHVTHGNWVAPEQDYLRSHNIERDKIYNGLAEIHMMYNCMSTLPTNDVDTMSAEINYNGFSESNAVYSDLGFASQPSSGQEHSAEPDHGLDNSPSPQNASDFVSRKRWGSELDDTEEPPQKVELGHSEPSIRANVQRHSDLSMSFNEAEMANLSRQPVDSSAGRDESGFETRDHPQSPQSEGLSPASSGESAQETLLPGSISTTCHIPAFVLTDSPIGLHSDKLRSQRLNCFVCTGLAVAVCGTCPLTVCINCQVVLDTMLSGSLDNLIDAYGVNGTRNDACLLSSRCLKRPW